MDHLDDETLSAALDGEFGEGRVTQAAGHLAACDECSKRLQSFRSVREAVASMPEISPTADEHRALRRAILNSRPGAKHTAAAWKWLLTGGLATAVIAVFAVLFIGREPPQHGGSTAEDAASAAQSLASDEQVREAVASDPAVAAALRRSRNAAGDGGTTLNAQPKPEAASQADRERLQDSAAQAPPAASPEDFSSQFPPGGAECLGKVGSAQSRPADPVLVRPVLYKAQEAWMLVFVSSSAAGGPRDQIEVWIISPQVCETSAGDALLAGSLHYSFFRP